MTDKLEKALEIDGMDDIPQWDKAQLAFRIKYGEEYTDAITQAARKWQAVEPLLADPKKTQDDIVNSVRADVEGLSVSEEDCVRIGVIRLARKIQTAIEE